MRNGIKTNHAIATLLEDAFITPFYGDKELALRWLQTRVEDVQKTITEYRGILMRPGLEPHQRSYAMEWGTEALKEVGRINRCMKLLKEAREQKETN